ncbi:probable E3 ubiquitin-protein ligase HERC3 [Neocloeon triangulifer]|uniref:probable E3 ubiquitin-protein ligase HERC3 n=1 Tax=Neocloeon triangulifer TaxID=2078957 RepID=UPI00286EB593|nr:probable E3 ubiquitin-protein ligase HERC3 [Neocloeon triangulifer]
MRLLSWGANQYGQLAHEGWPVFEESSTPQQCSLDGLPDEILSNICQICGGGGHTLLLDSDGCVWACGQNNRGQCGAPVDPEVKISRLWTKIEFKGFTKIVQVAAGWEHSSALAVNGQLFVWGSNSHGQMGNVVERGKWRNSPSLLAEEVLFVAAGLRQTAWIGRNGTIFFCSISGKQEIAVPSILRPIQIACGQKHNLVLMANRENDLDVGQVFCWGENKFGQMATNPNVHKTEELIFAEFLKGKEFIEVKSGWSHCAGIQSDGGVNSWGRSNYGQLGCSEQTGEKLPVLWPCSDNAKVKQICLGSEHTMVLTESGNLWTSGWNEHGNCGNGNLDDQFAPQLILSNVKLIGCGASHSFALVHS